MSKRLRWHLGFLVLVSSWSLSIDRWRGYSINVFLCVLRSNERRLDRNSWSEQVLATIFSFGSLRVLSGFLVLAFFKDLRLDRCWLFDWLFKPTRFIQKNAK